MDPAEFLRFASNTIKRGRPVDCRVAVSRAYYGVFNIARQVLGNDLPDYFLWSPRHFTAFSATLSGVGAAGAQLESDRNNSMYANWFLTA